MKHPIRYDIAIVGGINKLENKQLCQQQMPMCIQPRQQPMPIQPVARFQEEMVDVRTVIPLAILDVYFAPYQFFRGEELYRQAKKFTVFRMGKPRLIYATNPVDRIENNINEMVILKHFCQPT